ncbi:hypothetical protein [Aromatoleum evansii]|uniref:hypothetical protein n=1 Tax=Aromatoleum evansii TaxID=59406 RepID=UPI00145F4BB8|nr:hypothetical protein [Aromatoleum evansii]NMG29446.1 hypothetical protein [Aromatoleum evansii]
MKGLIYPFKVSIHGFARVVKAYESESSLFRKSSFWKVDDEIHGEALDGHSSKPISRPTVTAATATHKASFVDIRNGYAHVEIGIREHMSKIADNEQK